MDIVEDITEEQQAPPTEEEQKELDQKLDKYIKAEKRKHEGFIKRKLKRYLTPEDYEIFLEQQRLSKYIQKKIQTIEPTHMNFEEAKYGVVIYGVEYSKYLKDAKGYELVTEDVPIYLSDWTIEIGKFRSVVGSVIVKGDSALSISRDIHYLRRVYKAVYGKTYKKKLEQGTIKVIKIELKKHIGHGIRE